MLPCFEENRAEVTAYLKREEVGIDALDILPARAFNLLYLAGITQLHQLVFMTREELEQLPHMTAALATEIQRHCRSYLRDHAQQLGICSQPTRASLPTLELRLQDPAYREKIHEFVCSADLVLTQDVLSVRAHHVLARSGYRNLSDIIFLQDEQVAQLRGAGSLTVKEIRTLIRDYLIRNQAALTTHLESGRDAEKETENAAPTTLEALLADPMYRDMVLRYVRGADVALTQDILSVRAYNVLSRSGYQNLSDILFLSKEQLAKLRGAGSQTVEEIYQKLWAYLSDHRKRIFAFVRGEAMAPTEDEVRWMLRKLYQQQEFAGLHVPQILEKLQLKAYPEVVDKVLGKLVAEGVLAYEKDRVYQVYPSVLSWLEQHNDGSDRSIHCLCLRLQGETLESIARREGVTRERVRQIVKKSDFRKKYRAETGLTWFAEDQYRYLYSTYCLDPKTCEQVLGISGQVFRYLDMVCEKGSGSLEEAVEDPRVDISIRQCLRDMLYENTILVDGIRLPLERSRLEYHFLRYYCKETLSWDAFTQAYNRFLEGLDIPHTEKLYITQENRRGRLNRFASDLRCVLWTPGQRMRYYDIDGRDATDLLETLELGAYENIEFSTLKLFREHPELMARYDIRDHYELHNLLKKLVPEGSYHDFHCDRTPTIWFGRVDRTELLLELLLENAPIAKVELAELLHARYGVDKGTILGSGYLKEIEDYSHLGVYIIDAKVMTAEQMAMLKNALTEDFYFIDEVKRIYTELEPTGDPELVNPYNLKQMGFVVRDKYVLQNWPTIEAYLRNLLSGDLVELAPLRKRYGSIQSWYETLRDLRYNFELLEFEPDKAVSLGKLERSGVTKQDLRDFCEAVYCHLPEGAFFTARSLEQSGFCAQLYELGFSELFYAKLLCCDGRFSYNPMMGQLVLHKGAESVNTCSFLSYLVDRLQKVDIYDLIRILREEYGCESVTKTHIKQALQGSRVFYDPILERLYADAELYYRELDEASD